MDRRALVVVIVLAAVAPLLLLVPRGRPPARLEPAALAPPAAVEPAPPPPAPAASAPAEPPAATAAPAPPRDRKAPPRVVKLAPRVEARPVPAPTAPAPRATPAPAEPSTAALAPPPSPAPPRAAAPAPAASDRAGLTGAVRGSLLDRRGRPLAFASVVAISTDGTDAAETITDDDGLFLLSGLRPGRYAVFAGLGTALASDVGGRGVDVRPAEVSRIDLRGRPRGATVRVAARDARGRPAQAQAVLVAGTPGEPGTFASLLSSEAIYLPRPSSPRTVLADIPEGVYTLVLLQGSRQPIRAAWEPVHVAGGEDVVLEVELGAP